MPQAVPSVTTQSTTADAAPAPVGICPGECLPDDLEAKECAEPVVLDLEALRQSVLDGGSSSSVDASTLDADVLDASVTSAEGDANVDSGLDARVSGSSADGSSTLSRDAAGRPLNPVDQTSGVRDPNSRSPLSCQLVSVKGAVTAGCAPSGTGVEGSVCTSASDCAAGFGCVGDVGAGRCLRYCCSGDESCDENRYCDLQPMRSLDLDRDTSSVPQIPVCIAAEQCSLDVATKEDQRDAQGAPASCPEGSACTIVRANTTACRPAGIGKEGGPCPCANGFFCSKVTNTCLELCNTKEPSSCGQRECQPGPSGFPENWGLCVGG